MKYKQQAQCRQTKNMTINQCFIYSIQELDPQSQFSQ